MKPENAEKLYVIPVSKEKASEFITYIHRHHLPLDFGTYALGVCTADGVIHGVAIIGRTTTQHFDEETNHWVQEVRRVATDGTKNACSCLYAAAWRFVSAMGYRKLISYTLPEEGGASLRALGWKRVDNVGGNPWAHRSKRGYDIHPVGKKTRWEVELHENKIPPFNHPVWPVYEENPQQTFLDAPALAGSGVGGRLKKEMFLQTGFAESGEIFEVEEIRPKNG